MIESHAIVQLHLEQLIDRQFAPGVRETDDDAIDSLCANDRGHVGNRADDARIEHWLANLCGVRIDESDDLHTERVAKLVKLSRQFDGAGASADQQQPLPWTKGAGNPLEGHAPAGNHQQDDAGRHDEHAAAEHELREPEVGDREDDAGRAECLRQTDEQLAAIRNGTKVVQVGIIQAQLADDRDKQRLLPAELDQEENARIAPEPQPRAGCHGQRDERCLEADQRQRARGQAASRDEHQRFRLVPVP